MAEPLLPFEDELHLRSIVWDVVGRFAGGDSMIPCRRRG
jgi:hypothetical protein